MAGKSAKRRKAPERRDQTRQRPSTQPISTAGIDVISGTEGEPGAADPIDVAETARPMSPQRAKEIALAGGDLDADFHGLDTGEEAVGGSDPTPDQNDVDDIGTALGVVEQPGKPLATTEKIEGRDRERWELDPASSEDYAERAREEDERRRRRQP